MVDNSSVYVLSFPFTLSGPHNIDVNSEYIQFGKLKYSLQKRGQLYLLKVEGFSSDTEARDYLKNIWAGLMWLLLHRGISSIPNMKIQEVAYGEKPKHIGKIFSESVVVQDADDETAYVNGLIDGSRPAVYPIGKRMGIMTVGEVTLSIPNKADDFLNLIHEGASLPKSPLIFSNDKLRVALELYGAYFTEATSNARFLTLIMALEALADNVLRSQIVLDLVRKWEIELAEVSGKIGQKSLDALALESLRKELLSKKYDSIRGHIRSLVKTTLQENGDSDAEDMARKAVASYDLRSTLVHKGWLEPRKLNKATNDTKSIVERVLRAKFYNTVNTP